MLRFVDLTRAVALAVGGRPTPAPVQVEQAGRQNEDGPDGAEPGAA